MNVGIIIAIVVAVAGLLWLLLGRKDKALPPEEATPPTPARPAPAPRAEPAKKLAAEPAEPAPAAPPAEARAVPATEAAQADAVARQSEAAAEPEPESEAEPEVEVAAAPPPPPAEAAKPESDEERLQREQEVAALKKGLSNTRGGFIARLAKLFGGKEEIDTGILEEIEEVLITADVGVKTTQRILDDLRAKMEAGELKDEDSVWRTIRQQATAILDVETRPLALGQRPSLLMVVGVNGVGKTTTIGKLASRLVADGKKVLLAAGDTYRAAAVLQLEVWGRRVECPVVKGKEGADPGSVIFDAIKRGTEEGYDVVIADTAGRLHTKAPLMEELRKVERTATKALDGRAPDEILLVLDSTTGQNAVQQMHMFREALQVSGVVLTKLDGTAKGGVILGIVDQHRVPVRFIGLGEKVEDLREFNSKNFVDALFAKPGDETLAA